MWSVRTKGRRGQPDPSHWGFHAIYAEPKASDSARYAQSERVIGLLAGRAATECHESRCPLRTPLDDISLVPHNGTACPSGTCREARLESNRRNPVSEKAKRRGDWAFPLSQAGSSQGIGICGYCPAFVPRFRVSVPRFRVSSFKKAICSS